MRVIIEHHGVHPFRAAKLHLVAGQDAMQLDGSASCTTAVNTESARESSETQL